MNLNDELNELKSSVNKKDVDVIQITHNYNTIKDWKETKVKGLFEFIDIVFKTSSLLILEDMLKKGLRLNPIFKPKEFIFLREAVRNLNFKLIKLLNIYKFDLGAVEDISNKTLFDYFAVCPSFKKKCNFLDSKRILKLLLKNYDIFKSSLDKGISGIKFLILDPYLLFRMTLKKFGDPSAVWKTDYIFSHGYNHSKILVLKYLLEKSTKLKKNKIKILETIIENVFGNFKKYIWAKGQERSNCYSKRCLIFSMIKHSLNK